MVALIMVTKMSWQSYENNMKTLRELIKIAFEKCCNFVKHNCKTYKTTAKITQNLTNIEPDFDPHRTKIRQNWYKRDPRPLLGASNPPVGCPLLPRERRRSRCPMMEEEEAAAIMATKGGR